MLTALRYDLVFFLPHREPAGELHVALAGKMSRAGRLTTVVSLDRQRPRRRPRSSWASCPRRGPVGPLKPNADE